MILGAIVLTLWTCAYGTCAKILTSHCFSFGIVYYHAFHIPCNNSIHNPNFSHIKIFKCWTRKLLRMSKIRRKVTFLVIHSSRKIFSMLNLVRNTHVYAREAYLQSVLLRLEPVLTANFRPRTIIEQMKFHKIETCVRIFWWNNIYVLNSPIHKQLYHPNNDFLFFIGFRSWYYHNSGRVKYNSHPFSGPGLKMHSYHWSLEVPTIPFGFQFPVLYSQKMCCFFVWFWKWDM